MAKDDYFVIVYRILHTLYECFKAGELPEREMYSPEALGINNGYWVNVMNSLADEGYVTGVQEVLSGARSVILGNVRITQKGIEFLQENSMMKKAVAA